MINKAVKVFLGKECFLGILLTLSLISLGFPYGFPLIFPIVFLYFLFYLVRGKLALRINKNIVILYICIICYFWGLLNNSGNLYSVNIDEIANIIMILFLWLIISDLPLNSVKKALMTFYFLAAGLVFLISIISLYKFQMLLQGVKIPYFDRGGTYPLGTSLVKDYNMYAFCLYGGVYSLFVLFNKSKSFLTKLIISFSLLIIFISILFAGSRRGWITLVILLIYLLYKILRNTFLWFKNSKFIFSKKSTNTFLTIIFIVIFTFLIFNEQSWNYQDNQEFQKIRYRLETLTTQDREASFSERTERWEYAFELVGNYNFVQLLLGDGFLYIEEFSNMFTGGRIEDYPHNPIISALLYSGVVGFISSMIYIFIPFKKFYQMKDKTIKSLIYIYIISLLFLLPSANSIFSVPFQSVLFLMSFLLNNHKKH